MPEDESWTMPPSPFGLTARQKDFAREITRLAGLYTSPIILRRRSEPSSVYQNASGFLLKPGAQTFLITNAHVMNAYRELREQYEDIAFIFGGRDFEPLIVDEDPDDVVDLVVIDVSEMDFVQRAPGYWDTPVASLMTYSPSSWPLDGPARGEATLTVGCPRKFRKHEENGSVEFAAFPMLGQFVDTVTDRWFAIPFNREEWISSDFDPENMVIYETMLGGMSGSPVFALHRAGVHPLQLIGVVRTYGEGLDVLYCTRVDLISDTGRIGAGS